MGRQSKQHAAQRTTAGQTLASSAPSQAHSLPTAAPIAFSPTILAAAPWVLTAVAFGLRLYRLDREPLWFDEAYTALAIARPAGAIVRLLQGEGNAPLYYLLLHAWAALWGDSAEALRVLSALLGALTIPLLYWVGKRMFSTAAGLIAATLATLSPLHIHYSQEARMYSLLPLLAIVTVYLLYRLLVAPTRRTVVGFALAAIAGLYVHYYFLFMLPLVGLMVLAPEPRRALVPLAVALVLIAVGFAPWLPTFVHQAGGGVEDWVAEWWRTRPFWYAVPWSLESLGPGAQYPPLANFKFPSTLWARVVSLGFAVLTVGGAAIVLYQSAAPRVAGAGTSLGRGPGSERGSPQRLSFALLLGAVLVPLLIAFGVSSLRSPIYVVARHDMIAWGPYYLLTGAVLARLRPRVAIGACSMWCTLALFTLVPYFTIDRPKRNYVDLGKDIAATLIQNGRAGEMVIFTAATRTTTQYYLRTVPDRLRVVSFPLENDTHLGWVDPRIRTDPTFASAAAEELVQRLRASDDLPAVIWVVAPQSRGTPQLLSRLDALGYQTDVAHSTGTLLCLRRG